MRIGKLFHLTMLVDEFDRPQRFFNSIFSPLCTMHGYSSHWHRDAAIYVIAETSIEPMHVFPPRGDEPATSWYRYMERYGPRVHNLAFFVDDSHELTNRLERAGVRTTDGGNGITVFCHPKDTPGMLEFQPAGRLATDPRFQPSWDAFRREFWPSHPLGLERMSHVTILVHDLTQATEFYAGVLDSPVLEEGRATLPGTISRYVLVGEDTVVELAQPTDADAPPARELREVGQGAVAVAFKVGNIERAEQHLKAHGAPVASVGATTILLDRARTWGLEFRFTTQPLEGDPRA